MNKRFKIAIFLFCLVWILTAVQFVFSPFKLVGLNGAFYEPKAIKFSFNRVVSGAFQKEIELFVTHKTPFRSDFVRVNN